MEVGIGGNPLRHCCFSGGGAEPAIWLKKALHTIKLAGVEKGSNYSHKAPVPQSMPSFTARICEKQSLSKGRNKILGFITRAAAIRGLKRSHVMTNQIALSGVM